MVRDQVPVLVLVLGQAQEDEAQALGLVDAALVQAPVLVPARVLGQAPASAPAQALGQRQAGGTARRRPRRLGARP